ncbi:apolipo protein O-domain-containing protein [Apiospora arundinis]
MQVVAIFSTLSVMAAGASASPIEARQGHFPSAVGTINTYSESNCHGVIAENVAITDDCRALDEGIASIKYLSYDGVGIVWTRKFPKQHPSFESVKRCPDLRDHAQYMTVKANGFPRALAASHGGE